MNVHFNLMSAESEGEKKMIMCECVPGNADLLPRSVSEGSSAERFDGSASSPVRFMVSDFSRPFPSMVSATLLPRAPSTASFPFSFLSFPEKKEKKIDFFFIFRV